MDRRTFYTGGHVNSGGDGYDLRRQNSQPSTEFESRELKRMKPAAFWPNGARLVVSISDAV